MPARVAARTPASSPSVCIIRVKPVGAIANGRADGPPSTVRGVDLGDVAQDLRVELDVGEGLPRPGQRELGLRGAVGVVEGGARGAPLSDPAQIPDGLRILQPGGAAVEPGRPDAHERREISHLRYLAAHESSDH
ncbi:hypothetical protein TPB0596_07640 [Tsukamurella pulmonis]|nr:hypothetical protein TPB0596_07640 [Tsukamurella pulmonis]